MLAELKSEAEFRGLVLRVRSSDGYFGTARLHEVTLVISAAIGCEAEKVELGYLPWNRFIRVRGVKLRLAGPPDALWEDFHRLDWLPRTDVEAAQIRYDTDLLGNLVLEGARLEITREGDKVDALDLRVGAMSWRDVHFLVSRPKSVVQFRLGSDALHEHAFRASFVPSPGQGSEWTLSVPSQPFSEFAERAGFRATDSWKDAVVAGTGSLVLPEAKLNPRANLRFVIDDWHRANWPEAAVLTGVSGAVALSLTPSATRAPWVLRAWVEAGLFSLIGTGELIFDERPRLAFRASGTRTCAQLAEHLAPSNYRTRVRAYLDERRGSKDAETETVRLSLDSSLEVSSAAPPLSFRWHLEAGCGLSDLNEQ